MEPSLACRRLGEEGRGPWCLLWTVAAWRNCTSRCASPTHPTRTAQRWPLRLCCGRLGPLSQRPAL